MRKLQNLGRPFGIGQAAFSEWVARAIDEIQKASAEKTKGVETDGVFASVGIRGALAIGTGLSPAQITASQNNYAPTGADETAILRLTSDAARTLTGLLAPTDAPPANRGRTIAIVNVGSFVITLANESTSSTAANRFSLGAPVFLAPGAAVVLWYDGTSSRWRALAKPPGGWQMLATSAVAVPLTGTLTETVLATVDVPAGLMGLNGAIRVVALWSCTNSVNNKTVRIRFSGLAGTAFSQRIMSGGAILSSEYTAIQNRNAANSQVARGADANVGGWQNNANAVATGAIDTSVATTLVITGELANIGDTIQLERYEVACLSA